MYRKVRGKNVLILIRYRKFLVCVLDIFIFVGKMLYGGGMFDI